ncbi:MAG: septum formation protein Maf [Rhodospirillales bacterium]|nr:septum formation protein Maf [Rhodospirillales bacterium]
MTPSIVLASGSATRRAILEAAGLSVIIDRPDVDENRVKRDYRARNLSASETAEALAVAKAGQVVPRHPGSIILGADQMLECDGAWFDKPSDRAEAIQQISRLAGRTHSLLSAIVALRDGAVIWRTVESAELTMRPLSRTFIESYLDIVGDQVLNAVGGYQIEGRGIQLFSEIRGDHFTILGMPLLPLLAFLRDEGVVAE